MWGFRKAALLPHGRLTPEHPVPAARETPYLRKSREQIVVGLVSADPEPMEVVAFAVRDGTIRTANVHCPDLTLLLERQGRWKRLRLEQCKLRVGQHPDIGRQRLIAFPKLRQGKRLETHRYYRPLPIRTDSPRRICALTRLRSSMPAPSGEKSRSIWESHWRRSRSASQPKRAICCSLESVSIACWISLRSISVSYLLAR